MLSLSRFIYYDLYGPGRAIAHVQVKCVYCCTSLFNNQGAKYLKDKLDEMPIQPLFLWRVFLFNIFIDQQSITKQIFKYKHKHK